MRDRFPLSAILCRRHRCRGITPETLLLSAILALISVCLVHADVTIQINPAAAGAKTGSAITADSDAQPARDRQLRTVRRVGVFVGLGEYRDERLRAVKCSRRDALRMAQVMQDHGGLDQSIVLVDRAATLADVKRTICQTLVESTQPGDEIFIYWSGHGAKSAATSPGEPDGMDQFLVPYDGNPDDIQGTMVLDKTLAGWLDQLPGRVIVLIVDAASAGGLVDGKADVLYPSPSDDGFTGRAETAVLAACEADQAAFARQEGDLSAMTYLLARMIEQAEEGLTVEAAYHDLRREVLEYVAKHFNRQQTPLLAANHTRPIYLRLAENQLSLRVESPPEVYIYYSSGPEQLSMEAPDLQHGVFSHFLIEGLKGSADANEDGVITLLELGRFAQVGTRKYSQTRFQRKQVPQLVHIDQQGTRDVLSILDFELTSRAPSSKPVTAGRRWAVLIGASQYSQLVDLQFPHADVQALAKQLVAGGFRQENVTVIHDQAEHPSDRPLKSHIESHLDRVFRNLAADDLLVIAFSGHGVTIGESFYIAPQDADLKDLANTLISLPTLCKQLESAACGVRVLLLIDADRTKLPAPTR